MGGLVLKPLLVSGGGEDIYQEVLGGVGRCGINDVILGHW